MVGDNHLSEIEQCYTSTGPLVTYAENFLDDLKHLHFIKAIESLEEFVFHFQLDTQPCHGMADDVESIKQWAAQFKDIPHLIETVTKHYLIHKKAIKKDIAAEKADWAAGNAFKAGADIADAVTLALGSMNEAPAKVPNRMYLESPIPGGFINKVLAGFIYGFTKGNHLTEIEACAADVESDAPEVHQEVMKAISDFKAGGWDNDVQAVLELLLVGLQLGQVFKGCKGMQDDIQAIEAWATNFTDIKGLVPTLTKHFLFHKAAVEADIATLKADADAQHWFKTGKDAADIVTILLPVQEQDALF